MNCNTAQDYSDRMIMSKIKRRWSVRVTDRRDGRPTYMVVSVPPGDGQVHISIGGHTAITAPAERIERLRQVFHEARATALWDRGW